MDPLYKTMTRDELVIEAARLEAKWAKVREQLMEARKIVWGKLGADPEVRSATYDTIDPLREMMYNLEGAIDDINWILA